jgi:hypothetical protein
MSATVPRRSRKVRSLPGHTEAGARPAVVSRGQTEDKGKEDREPPLDLDDLWQR